MNERSRCVLVALVLLGTTDAFANLVSNPSFENVTGTFGGDGGRQLTSASTTLTDWNIAGGEIAVLRTSNSYHLAPSQGDNFLDLAGYSNTGFPKGITQSLSGLVPGQIYALALDLGILNGACIGLANDCHGPIKVMASIGGNSETFTHDSALPGNIWSTFGFNFKATASTEVLSIQGISLPPLNAYIGLDNVSVNAVPEPTVAWLFGAGFLLLGLRMIRRDR